VAVSLGLDDAVRADRAPGARAIDHDHGCAQQPRDLFAEGARGNVRGVARGERNHDTDRAAGERLGQGGGRQTEKREGENNARYDPVHGQDLQS
jgi:hypothetical protein